MPKYRLELENGASKYGAQMGRSDTMPEDHASAPLLHVTRVRFVSGGYDFAGCYWGAPENLYCCETDDQQPEYVRLFLRANNANDAQAQVRKRLPNARFYPQAKNRNGN